VLSQSTAMVSNINIRASKDLWNLYSTHLQKTLRSLLKAHQEVIIRFISHEDSSSRHDAAVHSPGSCRTCCAAEQHFIR
jgi:hypothetical protein